MNPLKAMIRSRFHKLSDARILGMFRYFLIAECEAIGCPASLIHSGHFETLLFHETAGPWDAQKEMARCRLPSTLAHDDAIGGFGGAVLNELADVFMGQVAFNATSPAG